MIKVHLGGYQSSGAINSLGVKKFRETIDPLFPKPKWRGVQSTLRHAWKVNSDVH